MSISELAFLEHRGIADDLESYTFSGLNFGEPFPGRVLVACASGRNSPPLTILSVTIGGVNADIAGISRNGGGGAWNAIGIAAALVPEGESGDVVVHFDSLSLRASVQLYWCAGISTKAKSVVVHAGRPLLASLNVPAGGLVIAGACAGSNVANFEWSGLEQDIGAAVESYGVSSASRRFLSGANNHAISVLPASTNNPVGVFASWEPIGSRQRGFPMSRLVN